MRLRLWRAVTVILMLAAGLVVASVATTASAQSTLPATDSSFVDATGTTVSKWLNAERVARAQALLETTELPVECIAGEVGFGTALSLRQHFAAQLGTSPSEYRKMFCLGMGESAAFVGIQ